MNKKKVYLGLTVDTIHHGHINLIKKASELGDVTIGLLTDKAVANHKRMPILNYKQRKIIIENIVGVKKVIAQEQWDYSLTVKKYKPATLGVKRKSGQVKPFKVTLLLV